MRLVPTRGIIININNKKKNTLLIMLLMGAVARANTAATANKRLSSVIAESLSASSIDAFIRRSTTRLGVHNRSFHLLPLQKGSDIAAASRTTFKAQQHSPCHHFSSFSRSRPLQMATSTTAKAPSIAAADGPSGQDMLAAFPGRTTVQGQNVAAAMKALAMADCVCFDVDSTVVDEEGIDVLAEYLGQGPQVAALTLQAMEGGMKFQDALKLRLDLLQPSQSSIQACLRDHPLRLTKGAGEFIAKLQACHKHVYLVSGGFRIMIEPVAQLVNVPKTNIVANALLFNTDGNYIGFDTNEPTSRDMGKPAALQIIQAQHSYKTMVMIGDGATDAQAKPPATVFIGYGGVVVRQKVQAVADWFVTDFDDLSYILDQYVAVGQVEK